MSKIISKIKLIIILFHTGCNVLAGQDLSTVKMEEVTVVTDRNLYIAGEEIFFSATLSTNEEVDSRILYCELITPSGTRIDGHKYLITKQISSGHLSIPSDLVTGNYYLRAYTKFMRNKGPGTYGYSMIKIVNPDRNEVQVSSGNGQIEDDADIAFINYDNNIQISARGNQFYPGDSVNISLNLVNQENNYRNLSLTIVPEFSLEDVVMKIPENQQITTETFFPENKGITLTGSVLDELNGKIIKGIRINLSIIGKGRDFMATRTDSSGRFYFTIPDYYGSRDIFMCTEQTTGNNPRILVDNDFCSIPVSIPTKNFQLSADERQAAYNMAVNYQIRTTFNSDTIITTSDSTLNNDQAFYGQPNETVYMDNYIQLPTLEEYFNGLPTIVKIRKRLGKKYFKVLGTQTGLTLYDPLVLVDFVAIDDPEKILSINPRLINKIEIINELYLKGDQTYGGIISFITEKGDFAGINLPSSGIFINYSFLENNSSDIVPDFGDNAPDVRNTLLWKPNIFNDAKRSAKVSTIAPETPGKYQVIIRGTDNKGTLVKQIYSFEVVK